MKKYSIILTLIVIVQAAFSQTFDWVRTFDGNSCGNCDSRDITVDKLGNIYTTGLFGDSVDFDPGPGNYTLTTTLGMGIYISKLTSTGAFIWAKKIEGIEYKNVTGITVDLAGNVYITGQFTDSIDFDPGPNSFFLGPYNPDGLINPFSDAFIVKLDSSGNFAWAKQIGGYSYDSGYGIAVDKLGNSYVTGFFKDSADFDPGPNTYILHSFSSMSGSIFVSKLDPSGNLIWAINFCDGKDYPNDIAIDTYSNIYLTGYFNTDGDFDPGLDTFIMYPNFEDAFISKFDSSGNFIFARQFGGLGNVYGHSISVDSDNNIYSTGTFEAACDFDPGAGVNNLVSAGGMDIYVSKLDSSGNFVWAKSFGGSLDDDGIGISADLSGNVYSTGFFYGTVDFDPGPNSYYLNAFYATSFISKLDESGNFAWAGNFTSQSRNESHSIATDSLNNIYTTGFFAGTIDFDPGQQTFYLAPTGINLFVHKMSQPLTGLADSHDLKTFCIYPNPSSINFIKIKNFTNQSALFILNDIAGKSILEQRLSSSESQINVSDLASGIYNAVIISETQTKSYKFIKL